MDIPLEIVLDSEAEVAEVGNGFEDGVAEVDGVGLSRVVLGVLGEGDDFRLVQAEEDLPRLGPFPYTLEVVVELLVARDSVDVGPDGDVVGEQGGAALLDDFDEIVDEDDE